MTVFSSQYLKLTTLSSNSNELIFDTVMKLFLICRKLAFILILILRNQVVFPNESITSFRTLCQSYRFQQVSQTQLSKEGLHGVRIDCNVNCNTYIEKCKKVIESKANGY